MLRRWRWLFLAAALAVLIIMALVLWPQRPPERVAVAPTAQGSQHADPSGAHVAADIADADAEDEADAAPVPAPAVAVVTGFRASPQQRAEDRERRQGIIDLLQLAKALAQRADAGDADAAMALADLLKECADVSQWLPEIESGGTTRRFMAELGYLDAELDAMSQYAAVLTQRCRVLMGDDVDALASARVQVRNWLQLAANLGHPGARLELLPAPATSNQQDLRAHQERTRSLLIELLADQDPIDLARHAWRLAAVSDYSPAAFQLLACRLGAPCIDHYSQMLDVCASNTLCAGMHQVNDLDALSPRDLAVAEAQIAQIRPLWMQGRYAEMLRSPVVPGAGP